MVIRRLFKNVASSLHVPCVFVFVFGGWGEEEMVPNSSVKNKQMQSINVFVK